MPYKDKEKSTENKKRYYQKNKKYLLNKARERYKGNNEEIKKKMREYSKKRYYSLKKEVFDIYGQICACCGESNSLFLTLDHIKEDGNKERKKYRGKAMYKMAVKEKDKTKYQILCFNCNQGRYINGGICPHKMNSK